MRVVVAVLLAANLAFLAWSQWIDKPTRAASPSVSTPDLPRLELASEAPPDAGGAPSPSSSPPASAEATAASSDIGTQAECVAIGPFASESLADRATAALRQRGLEVRRRSEAGEGAASFWVHIDDLDDAAEERRVLAQLRSSGIDDASAMPESAEGRRISVGIFSERARAERRAESVRRLGLSPKVTERSKEAAAYWIEVARAAGAEVSTQGLSAAGAQTLEVRPCPTPGA